ncbi:hypothetical protein OOJ91_26795 [Micromonospora lupini]|uniref:hypothetical protein n=1 Tax=Micromonospora lupini TaxID=285679 RepID=UPI00225B7D08|nr:hypothetical protein [Micromonospora lupini]MCX5069460.1 hypothetical protein [Micromonospora lupini]
MGDGLVDEFERYIQDATVSAALRDWAAGRDATVRPPCHGTRLRGHSGAQLIPVIVQQSDGQDPEQLYVKVLSATQAREETARHAKAVRLDAAFTERHLVPQPYPRYPVGDGRFLMFQDIAHGAEQVVPLAEVGDDQLRDAHRTLLDGVWGWHPRGRRITRTTVGRFVRRELTDADAETEVYAAATAIGLDDLDADWLHDPVSGVVLPNPLRFAAAGSLFHDLQLDQLCGASHGDLHGRNALFPCSRPGHVQVKKFCLVDLDRFAVDAPLTRDLGTLLLDFVLPEVGEAPRTVRADALRALLIDPAGSASGRLPALTVKVVRASYAVGQALAEKGSWVRTWRAQYLLSLLSQALICCTYDDAGPAGRAWYLRLAAHAALAYQREFRPEITPPAATGLPTLPGTAPQPAFPSNDRSARFDAVGPLPSQQNRSAPLDRTPTDQVRPSADPEAPPWPWGMIPIQQRPTPGGWHGMSRHPAALPTARSGDENGPSQRPVAPTPAGNPPAGNAPAGNTPAGIAPAGNRPGPAATGNAPAGSRPGATPTGNVASVIRAGVPGRPTLRDGGRRVNRPAPRHAVSARTNAIPRPRRATGGGSRVAPTGSSRIGRVPPKLRAVLAILLGSVSLTSLVAVGTSANRGRGETRVAPTEALPGGLSSGSATPAYTGSARRLAELALAVAGMTPTIHNGSYTVACRRIWAPADLAPGVDRKSYRDEQLWWAPALSGRRTVTLIAGGRPSGEPTSASYGPGDLTEIPPAPSADPVELRGQLAAQLGELPEELRTAAGMITVLSRIFRYHLLSPAQISALLLELAAMPGIQDRGAYPDWNDRTGYAFSADDTVGRRETVQFDPHTGELLSHETTTVRDNQILDYVLNLSKARTDRTVGPGCA